MRSDAAPSSDGHISGVVLVRHQKETRSVAFTNRLLLPPPAQSPDLAVSVNNANTVAQLSLDVGIVVQNDIQQGTVDFNVAVVAN